MLIGLVGRPNTGKSTFFKAATLAEVEIANYPFATIKANQGVGYVKVQSVGPEFNVQPNPKKGFLLGQERFVPVELTDVAGLVPEAHKGKGLGNQFLDDLREADAFIQIVDLSGKTNEEGKPAENYYPGKDIKFLSEELDMWFLNILKKAWKSFARKLEGSKENFVEAVAKQFSGLKINREDVETVIRKIEIDTNQPSKWSEKNLYKFASELRRQSKPMIIAANKADTQQARENLKKIKQEFDYPIIPCSSESELALREAAKDDKIGYIPGNSDFKIKSQLNKKQKKGLNFVSEYLREYKTTGVQDVLNHTVFKLLNHIAIFPVANKKLQDAKGNTLPDCHLLPKGSTALDLAYKIHQDFGDNFIKAIDMRKKQPVGKDHELSHRDVIQIMTS